MNRNLTYYLSGGLGNVLFGINEIFLLHKTFKERIFVNLEGTKIHVDSEATEAILSLLKTQNYLVIQENSNPSVSNMYNLGDFVNKKESASGLFYSKKLVSVVRNRTQALELKGWIPDLQRIKFADFFSPEAFFKLTNTKQYSTKRNNVVIHFRLGDYLSADHLGSGRLITKKYLKQAFQNIQKFENFNEIYVVSDSPELARKIVSGWFENLHIITLPENFGSVSSLKFLSQSRYFIGSNSTFSFWAHYFNVHGKNYFPIPFYYSNKKFEVHLFDCNVKRFPKHSLPLRHLHTLISSKNVARILRKLRRLLKLK